MRRPIVFVVSVGIALIALVVTFPFVAWILRADAPELVAPLLSVTVGGGVVFLIAVAVAIFAARRNSN
jgi:hypothetical protein